MNIYLFSIVQILVFKILLDKITCVFKGMITCNSNRKYAICRTGNLHKISMNKTLRKIAVKRKLASFEKPDLIHFKTFYSFLILFLLSKISRFVSNIIMHSVILNIHIQRPICATQKPRKHFFCTKVCDHFHNK